jgi:hypothetical protein
MVLQPCTHDRANIHVLHCVAIGSRELHALYAARWPKALTNSRTINGIACATREPERSEAFRRGRDRHTDSNKRSNGRFKCRLIHEVARAQARGIENQCRQFEGKVRMRSHKSRCVATWTASENRPRDTDVLAPACRRPSPAPRRAAPHPIPVPAERLATLAEPSTTHPAP